RQGLLHIRGGGPLLVRGKVEGGSGSRKLLAEEVRPLPTDDGLAVPPRLLKVRIPGDKGGQEDLEALRDVLAAHPGPVPVHLRLDGGGAEVLSRVGNLRVAPSSGLVGAVEALLGADAIDREM